MDTALDNIKQMGVVFKVFFYTLFYLTPIYVLVYWFSNGDFEPLRPLIQIIPDDLPQINSIPYLNQLFGFLITMIPMGFVMAILYSLARLFRLYQHGYIFTGENVCLIRRMAYLMLTAQLAKPVFDILISINMTIHNPPGERVMLLLNYTTMNLGLIITSFLILMIAYVMDEGRKLKEVDELTI